VLVVGVGHRHGQLRRVHAMGCAHKELDAHYVLIWDVDGA